MAEDPGCARAAPWTASPLLPSIQRFAALHTYADVGWGDPGGGDGWYPYEALCERAFTDRLLERVSREYEGSPQFAGTYVFRAAHYLPLGLAGFLFAAEGRVVRLRGNLALPDWDPPLGMRLLAPRAVVLPGDPAAGALGFEATPDREALTDALFAEVSGLAEPLLNALAAGGWLSPANGWGVLLDFLAAGFLAAGRAGPGLDAAWKAWERTIAGRSFPVRRLPRQLQYTVDGRPDGIMVNSHCCLHYTLPRARDQEHRYCVNCYLESDEGRIARLAQSRLAAGPRTR